MALALEADHFRTTQMKARHNGRVRRPSLPAHYVESPAYEVPRLITAVSRVAMGRRICWLPNRDIPRMALPSFGHLWGEPCVRPWKECQFSRNGWRPPQGALQMTDQSREISPEADLRNLARVISVCTLGLWAFAAGLLIGTFLFSYLFS